MNYRLHARTLQVKVLMFNLQLYWAIKSINNFSLFQPVAESSHSPKRFAPFHQGRKIRFVITDLLYYWIFLFLLLTLSSEWSLQNVLEACRRPLCRHDCRSREMSLHVDLLILSLHLLFQPLVSCPGCIAERLVPLFADWLSSLWCVGGRSLMVKVCLHLLSALLQHVQLSLRL